MDPEQFQDPDNEYGLFAGTTYEQDDEEADKIYEQVDDAMDSRRKARRCVLFWLVLTFFSCSSDIIPPSAFIERRKRSWSWKSIVRSGRRFSSSLLI